MIGIGMLEKLVIKVRNKQKYDKVGFFSSLQTENSVVCVFSLLGWERF